MKSTFKSDHPVTNEAAKAATGKTLDQWFAALDKMDGLKQGRPRNQQPSLRTEN